MTHTPARLTLMAVLPVLGYFLALEWTSWVTAGGVFEYPLDDPYIHLAMAEQIARGGYGVNPGEVASASSSPLYPLLLLPFAGQEAQRYLPLVWNLAGLILSAILWARILLCGHTGVGVNAGVKVGAGAIAGLWTALAAIFGPLALNFAGLAFTGMEHSLHLAASLAIVLGLIRFADTGRIGAPLVLGILFAPLLRFEGAALALFAAGFVAWRGPRGAGAVLIALALVPLAGFCLFLMSLGLDPLPGSVAVKLSMSETDRAPGPIAFVVEKLVNVAQRPREKLLVGFLAAALVLLMLPSLRGAPRRPVLALVVLAGLAHLLLGRFGWMNRYEIYILAALAAAMLALVDAATAATAPASVPVRLVALVPILAAGLFYLPETSTFYRFGGRGVHLQQAQMGRFVRDFWKAPVAVNDLGHVSWRNPAPVIDLWGLGSAEARRLRLSDPGPGWAGALAARKGADLAMVYAPLFETAAGDDWTPLGDLVIEGHRGYLSEPRVTFFATTPAAIAPIRADLKDWAKDLPRGALFLPAGAPQ